MRAKAFHKFFFTFAEQQAVTAEIYLEKHYMHIMFYFSGLLCKCVI